MDLFDKNLNSQVAVVAEIGVNHEGKVSAAIALMRLAVEAGADAVKFQSYTPKRYASASDAARVERVARFALDEAAHITLLEEAGNIGIALFSTPLTEDMVPFLAERCPAIKIASGDLTFEPVIRAAARADKPMILSTGAGTVDEIDQAVSWIRDEASESKLADRLVLMHCVSAYPTPIEEANVRAVPFLADRYHLPVGYSNHVIGIEACLAAVALGASVIEVHFTDRKEGRSFRDHELSLEPDELAELVRRAPRVRASLGAFAKGPAPCEISNMAALRKGVVAAHDLTAGTTLKRDDLMYARPASEFAAGEIDQVVGRRLMADVTTGELIRRDGVTKA